MKIKNNIQLAETARVHPSVILEGKIKIGDWTVVEAGAIIRGEVTVGHHVEIRSGVVIRVGRLKIGDYAHIYDLAQIGGGGRPWTGAAEGGHQSIIGTGAWINHGAVVHSTWVDDYAAVGLNAVLDYGCKLGKGSILANGSACPVATHIPDNCLAEGVPARIIRTNITDEDRRRILGLVPREAVFADGSRTEERMRRSMGKPAQ